MIIDIRNPDNIEPDDSHAKVDSFHLFASWPKDENGKYIPKEERRIDHGPSLAVGYADLRPGKPVGPVNGFTYTHKAAAWQPDEDGRYLGQGWQHWGHDESGTWPPYGTSDDQPQADQPEADAS